MQIAIASPALIGNYENLKDLRNKIVNWLKSNFYEKTVVNEHTKFEIGFNSKSFNKLVSGNAGTVKLLCLTAIEQIIKFGILESVEVDKRERAEIIAIYYFSSVVQIDGNTYKYWFTVRQLLNGKFIYSGNLNIKKPL